MNNISDKIISLEEAKTALRCMRLGNLSEDEALETLDEFAFRIRNLTTVKLVERIIEKELTPTQRRVIKLYLYDDMNTAQIGKQLGFSQPHAYQTLMRANETICHLMTPLIEYQNDIVNAELVPLQVGQLLEICAARNSNTDSFCKKLRNLRISYAITEQRLSSNLKISRNELLAIESGKRLPSLTTVMRYSALFDAEIEMKFKNGRGVYSCKRV
jgi:DNA-binding XRE family transcriptional regulator